LAWGASQLRIEDALFHLIDGSRRLGEMLSNSHTLASTIAERTLDFSEKIDHELLQTSDRSPADFPRARLALF
jgi:hypothetical protein